MSTHICKTFLILFLSVLCWWPQPVAAQTADTQAIQIEPTFQELAVSDTSASTSGSLTLRNLSDHEQQFELSAVDMQQFDSQGQITLADKPLSGAGAPLSAFIILAEPTVTIPPKSETTVTFSVSNQPQLGPGGHYAVLVARLSSATALNRGQQVLPAVSSFVLVRKVGGERYHLSLVTGNQHRLPIDWRVPKEIKLTFSNQGNIHVVPRGLVTYTDLFGRITHKGIINETSLYLFPSTNRTIPVTIKQLAWSWPLMIYTRQVQGQSDPGSIAYAETDSFILVQPAAVIGCGLLAGGGIWGWRWHQARRQAKS